MAFPAVEATALTSDIGPTASTNVLLPATVSAGALLVVLCRCPTAGAIGFPAGWTIISDSAADASDDNQAVAYKSTAAVGNEDGTTIAVTHAATSKMAAISYSITGAADPAVTPPQISTVATGTSTVPDPTTCTPTGGAKDYLWLWLGGWEGEQTTPPASNPTNYTNPIGQGTGTAGAITTNVRVAGAQRQLNAASEDPGSWTISVSDDWMAWTMAVHPAGAPPDRPIFGQKTKQAPHRAAVM